MGIFWNRRSEENTKDIEQTARKYERDFKRCGG